MKVPAPHRGLKAANYADTCVRAAHAGPAAPGGTVSFALSVPVERRVHA